MSINKLINSLIENVYIITKSPQLTLCLSAEEAKKNHEFFYTITKNYFQDVISRHPKFPIFRKMTKGVAVCPLTGDHQAYLKSIESSGRRNVKKAIKNGYSFSYLDFNEYLDDIWDIRKSSEVRQGKMPDGFLNTRPKPITDPKSLNPAHDFKYYGVFNSEQKLVAYAGCFIAGDIIELSHYYGHFDHQSFGVVPLLITSIAQDAIDNNPQVKAFVYGGYIGASDNLKRFKKKFNFKPHNVTWKLS